jgi:glutathione S-transferase
MKIWGTRSIGNPVRVAVFLQEKGIDIPFMPVNLNAGEHRSADFLARNVAAQTPVLELEDGTCIAESIAICRYLERLYPEPPLMGDTPLAEALIEMWQRRVELLFCEPARAVLRHSAPGLKPLEPVQLAEWAEFNRPRVAAALALFDPQLRSHRYLAGDAFSIADISALFGFWAMRVTGIPVPDDCPSVLRWRDDLLARPSVVAVINKPKAGG